MEEKAVNNPYVWLVWGLPGAVVLAGIATVFIAFSDPDPLVSDDYYRDGLAINQSKDADARAQLMQLSATLSYQNHAITVSLKGNLPYPDTLHLSFEHPTRAQLDRTWVLQHAGNGVYRADDNTPKSEWLESNWYINLSPIDRAWRLRTSGNLSASAELSSLP